MNNDNAKVAILRARQLLKDKRYPDALQVCVDELARGTDDPELRLVAAHALLAQGRHEGAKKEALQVVRLDPARPEAHRILADVACARGELATACEHLEQVLELEPGDERSHALFETLSRPSSLPAPGSEPLSPKMRAASLERFIDSGPIDGGPIDGGPIDGGPINAGPTDADGLPARLPELQISDSMLQELPGAVDDTPPPMEVSDSMLLSSVGGQDSGASLQVMEDQLAERLPQVPNRGDHSLPGLSTLHDPPSSATRPPPGQQAPGGRSGPMGVMDAGAGSGARFGHDGTLRLPALDETTGEEDEAPTVPLLRPSAPPEPQLRLDPLASSPVTHDPVTGGPAASHGPMTDGSLGHEPTSQREADPTVKQSGAPRMAPGDPATRRPDLKDDDGFDDFEVEPASVPLPKGAAAAAVGGARRAAQDPADPLAMMAGDGRDSTEVDSLQADSLDGLGISSGPARDDSTGGLMAMMSGGQPSRGDESLPRVGSKQRKPPRSSEQQTASAAGGDDDGWDPEADMGGGRLGDFGGNDAFSGDDLGLADMMEPDAGVIDGTDDAIERELMAAGISEPKRKRGGGFKRFMLIFLAIVIVGGGVAGYLWYRNHKYIQGEWQKLRTALHKSTPAAFKEVDAAAKRILDKRASSKPAKAALAFLAAAQAIEFGEDRLKDAKKLLEETKGAESEWRTAARGYLSLIDDPTLAAGYLAKGVEVYPDSAVLKYLQARALASSGALQKAADTYGKALKQQPKYVAARVQLAVLIGEQEKGYEQALSQLEELLRSHPNNIQALIERARLSARHGKALSRAAEDAGRVTGELAEKAGRGQLGWAQLVLAQVARKRGDAAAMSTALDAAIKAPPCCDSDYRNELAGELINLFRFDDAHGQMREALADKPKQPKYLQRMARLLLEIGQVKKAAEYVGKAPARQLETKLLSGWLAYAQGRYAKAEALLKQVLAEKPDHVEAGILSARNNAARKRTTEALKSLAALATKHATDHRVFQIKGLIQLRTGELAEAEKSLRASWKLNGLDPRTPTYLAQVSMASHDYARAAKRFGTALRRRPDFAPALIGLARLKLRVASVAEARKQANAISAADRESPGYHLLLAELDLAENKIDSAEANVGRAEAAGARGGSLARLQGHVALMRGKGRQAVAALTKARRNEPKSTDVLVLLGRAQLAARMDDDAYTTLKSALKIDPENPDVLLQLGRVGILDDEFGLAVRDLQKALAAAKKRNRPASLRASIFSILGLAYLRKGDTGQAIANCQDAMDLDPSAAEPNYHMGQTYDALKRPAKAVAYYGKAIQLDPNLTDAYRRIGQAYVKAGDNANGAKYLQAYLGKNPPSRRKAEVSALLRKIQ